MSSINFSKLLDHAGSIVQHIARAYGHRSQLASLEAIEARQQLMKIGALVCAALVLGMLGLFLLALTIAALVWPMEQRVQILGLVTAGFIIIGAVSAVVAWRRLHTWSPLPETRRQLHEDCVCLGDLISESNSNS